ncbi:malate dehydrogenase [Flagelloscypha sp. PMI_526]|nr:malate dehydrogenase [Flagelloscypha sp. PMI_526]
MAKVVILGAAGGIGQSLSLLLKANPLIRELGLYDVVNVLGVAADLSHIATPAKVVGFLPPDDGLSKVLADADIVIIPAGVAMPKPGTEHEAPVKDFRDQLFNINAGILRDLATSIAKTSPKAFVLIISNPVNSLVPLVSEVFKQHGIYDPKRLFGVTTLDVERAATFVAEVLGDRSLAPNIVVPVVGGHSGPTIVPLLSQSSHPLPPQFTEHDAIVHRIQFGGAEVVKAKANLGSATLSMAQSAYDFTIKLIKARNGEPGIVTPTYVDLEADVEGGNALKKELEDSDLGFFAVPVELGEGGIKKIHGIGVVTDKEREMIRSSVAQLHGNISKGLAFITRS